MMKICVRMTCLAAAILTANFLAGCNKKNSEDPKVNVEKGKGVSYEEGKGLLIGDSLKASIGLSTAKVEARDVDEQQTVTLQVFRESAEKPPRGTNYREGFAYGSCMLPAKFGSELSVGEKVDVINPANPANHFIGKVDRLDSSLKDFNGQAELLVAIPDPERSFSFGGFLKATLPKRHVHMQFAVPKSALLETAEGAFLYIVDGNYLKRVAIQTGGQDAEFVDVREGVNSSSVVVTKPVQTLWLTELQAHQDSGP